MCLRRVKIFQCFKTGGSYKDSQSNLNVLVSSLKEKQKWNWELLYWEFVQIKILMCGKKKKRTGESRFMYIFLIYLRRNEQIDNNSMNE